MDATYRDGASPKHPYGRSKRAIRMWRVLAYTPLSYSFPDLMMELRDAVELCSGV